MPDVLLSIKNVEKTYAPSETTPVAALNGVTLDVFRGEFLAITGSSGSGKSTLLNLIGLLDAPSQGTMTLDTQDIHNLDESEKALFRLKTISFVFQFFNLIDNFTALENISFQLELQGQTKAAAKKKALETLEYVQLANKANLYPSNLSGGEQQRVAIGRALAKDSLIILADEPTAHLDSKNAEIVMNLLREINTKFNRTIVLVTHEPHQAEQADRQVILRDGQVAEIRTHSQNTKDAL